jgi:hypothetical protein
MGKIDTELFDAEADGLMVAEGATVVRACGDVSVASDLYVCISILLEVREWSATHAYSTRSKRRRLESKSEFVEMTSVCSRLSRVVLI